MQHGDRTGGRARAQDASRDARWAAAALAAGGLALRARPGNAGGGLVSLGATNISNQITAIQAGGINGLVFHAWNQRVSGTGSPGGVMGTVGSSSPGPGMAVGVVGQNTTDTSSGAAVLGKTTNSAIGVYGWSASGNGVRARSDSGTALRVTGTSDFDDDANFDGTVTAAAFSGSASGLTGLNATQLTSGTVNDARLSTNIPRKNGVNAYSAANSFGGASTFNGTTTLNGAALFNDRPVMPGFASSGRSSIQFDSPSPDSAGTTGRALLVKNQGAAAAARIGLHVHAGNANPPTAVPIQPIGLWATAEGTPTQSGTEGMIAILGQTSAGASTGVKGVGLTIGVAGEATNELGRGVHGVTAVGVGVEGVATGATGAGVRGVGEATGAIGVLAESPNGVALQAIGPTELQSTRVQGSLSVDRTVTVEAAAQTDNQASVRVLGLERGAGLLVARSNDHGATPRGQGLSPFGVTGLIVDFGNDVESLEKPAGTGVNVRTTTGPAIRAESSFSPAVDVHGSMAVAGRVVLERLDGAGGRAPIFENAGTATIPAGKAAISVPDASVRASDSVVATLQGNGGTGVLLRSAVALNGKLNLVLSKRATRPVKVAYFVMRGA